MPSSESQEHLKIKTLLSEKLKAWTGATLKEYQSSGHELDIYAMTPDSISIYVEIIWSDSLKNFFRDMSMIQASDAKVKLVVASPMILSKKNLKREFEKVTIAQKKLGFVIHGDLIEGQRIIEDSEYVENEFREIVMAMLQHVRKSKEVAIEKAETRLREPVQIDHTSLLQTCIDQAKRNTSIYRGDVQSLYKKFIPDLYVARHDLESIFDNYVESFRAFERDLKNHKVVYQEYEKQLFEYRKKKTEYDEKELKAKREGIEFKDKEPLPPLEPIKPKAHHCVAFVGEAGIGKTNFLIALCDQLLNTRIPALFYAGHTMVENLDNSLISDFFPGSESKVDSSVFLKSLNETLKSHDSFLIIVLDAINESRNYKTIGKEIVDFIDKLENLDVTRVKLVVSCRDIEWTTIAFGLSNLNDKIFQSKPFYLGKLNMDELREVWEKYKKVYDLKTVDFESLSPRILSIVDQPLMFRFLCEAYSKDYLPRDIERLDIFEKYWERKFTEMERIGSELGTTNLRSKATVFIFEIIRKMRELKQQELLEYEVEKLAGERTEDSESVYIRLLSEHIIIYSRVDVKIKEKLVGFTYEAFFEYALAKLIYIQNGWHRLSEDEILTQFRTLTQESYEYRPMRGALQYLILSFSREETSKLYLEMLNALIETNQCQGCEVAYEVISRLRVINVEVFKILQQIIVATTGSRTIYRSWGQDHVATEILSNIPNSSMVEVFDEWRRWALNTYNMLHANTHVAGFGELVRDRPEKALKMLATIFSDEQLAWLRIPLTPIFLRTNTIVNGDTMKILASMASHNSRNFMEVPFQFFNCLSEDLKNEMVKHLPELRGCKYAEIQVLLPDLLAKINKG